MIQAKFEQFHAENPHVFETLEGMAALWLAKHGSVGMKMLWEVLRWQIGVDAWDGEYRLNNNYTSRYARLLLAKHPEWQGRIGLRQLQTA